MYDKDLIGAGIISALGAGVVTSFAVSQGQHPMLALLITAIAGGFGAMCHKLNLI